MCWFLNKVISEIMELTHFIHKKLNYGFEKTIIFI